MDPPVTGGRLFTRDGTYFQLIRKDSPRLKKCIYTIPSCCGSSPTAIIIWYQYVTIYSATHRIYVHPYYCFKPEAYDSKGFSSGYDTNTTKKINGRHKDTEMCRSVAVKKWRRDTETEIRESTERAFEAYGGQLEAVDSFT